MHSFVYASVRIRSGANLCNTRSCHRTGTLQSRMKLLLPASVATVQNSHHFLFDGSNDISLFFIIYQIFTFETSMTFAFIFRMDIASSSVNMSDKRQEILIDGKSKIFLDLSPFKRYSQESVYDLDLDP